MIKFDFNNSSYKSEDLIKELKGEPALKSYNINVYNLNQFLIVCEEANACASCKGISECKNKAVGYRHKVVASGDDYNFPLEACKFKELEDKKNKASENVKTKYVSKALLEASLNDFSLNSTERKKAYEYAGRFITNYSSDNFMKGLLVYGGYGSGKTYFLAAIANELSRRGLSVFMIYFPDLAREIKAMQFDSRLEELINELKSVDVLMIDDLGGENLNAFLRDDIIGPILNYRMSDKKAVFISTNLRPEELGRHFSQTKEEAFNNVVDENKASRIMRRISELTINCDFKDNRYNG